MRISAIFQSMSAMLLLLLTCCETAEKKEERLAQQYCSNCHMFPEPALLDKKTWDRHVMPQMAFRMGFENMQILMQMSDQDRVLVSNLLPANPMLSQEEFDLIRKYYQRLAPDSLTLPAAPETRDITQFTATSVRLPHPGLPLSSLIKFDPTQNRIYVGNRWSRFYTFTADWTAIDSVQLPSPPSDILIGKDSLQLLLMGIMDPNDQARGALVNLSRHTVQAAGIDSLQRPVRFEYLDFNRDGLKDYVICAFGNYSGALLLYENKGQGKFEKHVLMGLPGARQTVIRDFDNNGLPDIAALFTQGDEKIVLLLNQGNFDFRVNTVLRFPPVYGSSYFEINDFNKDGKPDILYTNGDNADYSIILKPYHGVHIFLNDGTNHFTESWSHPMYGASQARSADFDADGDVDIAVVSFFPDFNHHSEHGFYYFENTGTGFELQTTPLAANGRWLTLEAADIDHDNDVDIMLLALDFEAGVPRTLVDQWHQNKTSVLVLRNNLH